MADNNSQIKLPPGFKLETNPKLPTGFSLESSEQPVDFTQASKLQAPYVGRLAVDQLPAIGGSIGEFLEPAGGAIPGAAFGTAVKNTLRDIPAFQPLVGTNPGAAGLIGEAIGDQLFNVGIPKLINKAAGVTIPRILANSPLRNLPAVREGVAGTISRNAMFRFGLQPESSILEKSAGQTTQTARPLINAIQDARSQLQSSIQNLNPDLPSRMVDYQAAVGNLEKTFGKNQVGQQLLQLQREIDSGVDVAKSQTYKSIANTTLSDLTHVRNFKLATGSPEGVENLALHKLLTNNFEEGKGTLNVPQMVSELTGKNAEIYGEAIRPETMSNLKDLLAEIQNQTASGGVTDRIIHYSKGHLVWSGAPILLGAATGHVGVGAAASAVMASPLLVNSLVAKLMANPTTAKMVTQAMRTSTISPEGDLLERSLRGVIRSSLAAMRTPTSAEMGQDQPQ